MYPQTNMVYDLAAKAGQQWPFETLVQLGDINQRALDRVTDFQWILIQRNLDTLLELSAKTTTLLMEARDDYLSVLDGLYKDSMDKPEAVTEKPKVTKKKAEVAVKKSRPVKKTAGRNSSTGRK